MSHNNTWRIVWTNKLIVSATWFKHQCESLLKFTINMKLMQERQRVYTVLRKALHLTVVDGSEVAPTDISYVHSVYAPLSVRLAQHMAQPGGWRGLADVLPLLPGPTLDKAQDLPPGQAHRRKYQFYNF